MYEELFRNTDFFRVGDHFADRGVHLGEMSNLAWLIGFVKHALYFLYLLLLSVPQILALSQLTL
jgi:hypothetical protein